MKVVILALAGGERAHLRDEEAQRNTWARNSHQIEIIWVHGSEEKNVRYLDRRLLVPIPENYSNLLKKTIEATRWIEDNLEYDFLIRSNVSSYFDIELLLNQMYKAPSREFVGGAFQYYKSAKKEVLEKFINGAGIYMSRDVVKYLNEIKPESFQGIPDDVAISRYLGQKYDLQSVSICNLCMTHFFYRAPQTRVKSQIRKRSIRTNWITPKRMHNVHSYYQSEKLINRSFQRIKLQMYELLMLENPKEYALRLWGEVKPKI